jgi:glycerophosphoryl diester phosphodiesterase
MLVLCEEEPQLSNHIEAQNHRQALSRPIEIVCHRMANEHAPENTFAAAQLCVDWGVDYVEADVWTSRDGVFYLMHDFTVDRTTNGTGYILALTSSEIDRLDAGSWFGPQFAGEKVPRLEDFLRWIKGQARVFLDVKFAHPQQLIDLLYATGMAGDCFLWCQSAEWMRIVRALDPMLALKVNVRGVQDVVEAAERYRAQIVEVGLENMSPELIAACRERGLKIMVIQTEKDAEAFRQVLQWGADMINLDHADVFLDILSDHVW